MCLNGSFGGWVDRSDSSWRQNGGNNTRKGTEGMKKEPLITCNIITLIQNIVAYFEVKRSKKVTVRVREGNSFRPKSDTYPKVVYVEDGTILVGQSHEYYQCRWNIHDTRATNEHHHRSSCCH